MTSLLLFHRAELSLRQEIVKAREDIIRDLLLDPQPKTLRRPPFLKRDAAALLQSFLKKRSTTFRGVTVWDSDQQLVIDL